MLQAAATADGAGITLVELRHPIGTRQEGAANAGLGPGPATTVSAVNLFPSRN